MMPAGGRDGDAGGRDAENQQEEPLAGVGCVQGCARDLHVAVMLLSASFAVLLIMYLACLTGGACHGRSFFVSPVFWVVFALVAALFLAEAAVSDTLAYLRNINTTETLLQYVARLRQAAPTVVWTIQCYHFETRTRVVSSTDAQGRSTTRTETYQERVNTHYARDTLKYARWQDVSRVLQEAEISEYKMTKVNLNKAWTGDAGCMSQKTTFIAVNNRDVHYDFFEDLQIPGYTSRLLCLVHLDDRPFMAHWAWFLLFQFSIVGALPYRMWLSSITGKVHNTIHKDIQST